MKLDDDAIERALAALPLEEPPPDLHASILAATVYRPAPLFSVAEVVAGASVAAALVWIAIVMATQIAGTLAAALSNLQLLAWVGTGIAIATWLNLFTISQPAYAVPQRAKGRVKP